MPRKADHVVVELVHDPKSADRDEKRSERDAVLSRALARKVHSFSRRGLHSSDMSEFLCFVIIKCDGSL